MSAKYAVEKAAAFLGSKSRIIALTGVCVCGSECVYMCVSVSVCVYMCVYEQSHSYTAHYTLLTTGAGLSVSGGIPTYRDENGVRIGNPPMEHR
jgi:hypothetical protein